MFSVICLYEKKSEPKGSLFSLLQLKAGRLINHLEHSLAALLGGHRIQDCANRTNRLTALADNFTDILGIATQLENNRFIAIDFRDLHLTGHIDQRFDNGLENLLHA